MDVNGQGSGEAALPSRRVAAPRPEERPAPVGESAEPAGEVSLDQVVAAAEAPTDSWGHWGKLGLGALVIVLVTFAVLAILNNPA
jgi:hypothetical protein